MTRFQEERPGLAAAGPALWPRFAGYYQGLSRLPRKARRALQRRWRRSLGGLALLCALGQAPALAATISVGGACTLIDAITAANNNAPTGGCTAGSGTDTLALPAGSTHTLTAVNNTGVFYGPNSRYGPNGLPLVTSAIVIDGNGSTISRDPGAPPFRILEVATNGDLTLRDTTVSGGVSGGGTSVIDGGGGMLNGGTLTLKNSTVSGNSAAGGFGGGVANYFGTLTMTDSTVSGNSAARSGGGMLNRGGTVKLTNSTVSGNSAPGDGGGLLNNYGSTLALINSTVSGNTAGNRGGGVLNGGGQGGRSALFLIQTLVSGNSAFVAAEVLGPEVFNIPVNVTPHIVIADNFNLFGHDGLAGIVGFTPGPTDFVPNAPLAAVLNPTLGDNGGLTRTHALVAGSPAADAVPAASCATVSDQRGVLRPQDSDADTIADCDIGAFELQLSPAPPPPSPPLPDAAPADPNPQARCTRSRCDIRIRCNLDPASGVQCTDRIRFLVSERDVRLSEAASTKAARRIRFAAGFTNVQPGETRNVRLRLTKQGKEIVRTSRRKRIRGVMEIRNPGGATSTTRIRIRLR